MSDKDKNINDREIIEQLGGGEYKHGFVSDIETETIGKGLSEEVVRTISQKKDRKSTRLNSSHCRISRMPSSA